MRYVIQDRIYTLIEHAIFDDGGPSSFNRSDISFSAWHSTLEHFGAHKFWIASSEREAPDIDDAWKSFQRDLNKVVPRIAFVGQAYLEAYSQPFLIRRTGADLAFFRYTRDRGAAPLMFMEEELRALDALIEDTTIRDEFYYYWNDATNTVGYSPKLVLMFAALEILFKEERSKGKEAFYAKVNSIFGPELTRELYGTKEDPASGLRQRLVHGEYLGKQDTTKNYVEEIHNGIIRHFNIHILRENPLNEHIVNPQRHPFGNIEGWNGYIKSISEKPLDLKSVVEAFDADFDNPDGYEIVPLEERPASY
jgi:hypothetical protein